MVELPFHFLANDTNYLKKQTTTAAMASFLEMCVCV